MQRRRISQPTQGWPCEENQADRSGDYTHDHGLPARRSGRGRQKSTQSPDKPNLYCPPEETAQQCRHCAKNKQTVAIQTTDLVGLGSQTLENGDILGMTLAKSSTGQQDSSRRQHHRKTPSEQ